MDIKINNIELPRSLQQKIIQFVETNDSQDWVAWDYELSVDSKDLDRLNRGRKLTFTYLHNEIDCDVNLFGEQVIKLLDLDKAYVIPIPQSELKATSVGVKHLPHILSILFKDDKKSLGIQKHTDPRNEEGWFHLRFNFMVQSAEGGDPIIKSTVYSIDELKGWICFSSEWVHSALPVTGDKKRIMLSLGYYIEPEYAKTKFKNLF